MKDKEILKRIQEMMKEAEKNGENIKKIRYIEQINFLEEEGKYTALCANDVFIKERIEEIEGEEQIFNDFFNKDGESIAITNENGNIEFSKEYIDKINNLPEEQKEILKKTGFEERSIDNEEVEEQILEKEEEKVKEQIPEKKEEKVEKIEKDLGIEPKDIGASSKITDSNLKKYIPQVNEYGEEVYMIYVESKHEFQMVGYNDKTKKFEPIPGVKSSQSLSQKNAITHNKDGSQVKRKTMRNILTVEGKPEIAFSAEMEIMEPIEVKFARKELGLEDNDWQLFEMQTEYYKKPPTLERDKVSNLEKNYDLNDEGDKFRKIEKEQKEEIITDITHIKDNNQQTANDRKKMQKEKEEGYEKSIWDIPEHNRYKN